MKNELHVNKLITEMPKLQMTHNARLVLYTVLKKSWQTFRNREGYISKEVLTAKDIKDAQKPVVLNLSDLKPLFFKGITFKEIEEHILTIPYEAQFKTYYNLYGVKTNELMNTKIALFKKVQASGKKKEITFEPSDNLIIYLEALKSFAKIDIEELKKLSGNYQIRGYELICQNNYLDKNNNKLISDEARKIRVDDFRRYFEVPSTYNVSNIDMRVLRPLKKAINKYTKYNIIEIKKFKLDSNDKKKVSHYRIDVEYKKEYLDSLKEESNEATESQKTTQLLDSYPVQNGKAELTNKDIKSLEQYEYEIIESCIKRYLDYIEEKKKEGFNQSYMSIKRFFTKGYIDYLDKNYREYKAQLKINSSKPEQSTNFEQREYDDEFFDSLYDNY